MPTRRYGPNPRWWPEGEQWPPQGGHGSETWSGFGRKMFAGAILFITTIVVMAAVAGAIIATSLAGISSGSRWPIVFGTLFLLLVGIRLIRSSGDPCARYANSLTRLGGWQTGIMRLGSTFDLRRACVPWARPSMSWPSALRPRTNSAVSSCPTWDTNCALLLRLSAVRSRR